MTAEKPGTLLVVDDNEMNRDLLSRRLQRRGYEVSVAAGGAEAIDFLESQAFDAILLDIMMPEISGWDVLNWIRKKYTPAQLPVIMATAKDSSEDIVQALQSGANDYVTKPLDMKVVLARVDTQVMLKQTSASLVLANQKLEEANDRLKRDLAMAARVQQAQLPEKSPRLVGCEVAWAYKPCDELAGDFLDVFDIDEHNIGLYLIDVSGHGVQAALMSVAVSRALKPSASDTCVVSRPDRTCQDGEKSLKISSPAEVADKLNERFPSDIEIGQYFTMIYGIFNKQTKQLRFTSAGHPRPVILHADGSVELVDSSPGFPIGVIQADDPDYELYPETTINLKTGDRICFYSDGVPEAKNVQNELYGDDKMLACLAENAKRSLDDCVTALLAAVLTWAAPLPPNDDVSVLIMEIG
jgi:sigma-B regulation protein RsbU (phosphoserine phosphatase)